MLPDDVILNTRRAFSTINTTLDGYSTSLGAPEGRYIAPANSASCIQVKAGDCAPRNVLVLAPWFKRFDFGAAKKIGIGGSKKRTVPDLGRGVTLGCGRCRRAGPSATAPRRS